MRLGRGCFVDNVLAYLPRALNTEGDTKKMDEFKVETQPEEPRCTGSECSGLLSDGCNPSEEQVRSACTSVRHDYGLMGPFEKENLRSDAREWLRAWQYEITAQRINNQKEKPHPCDPIDEYIESIWQSDRARAEQMALICVRLRRAIDKTR